ncbi:MAG: glycosyltransferase [Erysipelotrichaceae bacterium]|nr:glycosyltransferase [Erysipelotrichaceae bacterium]MDD3924119.1 glycosyltransferase [Erysipelotrichaceae bacterium]
MNKRILFINDEMTLGGVSRILNNLLTNLDTDKYDIDLLVLHPHGDLMNQIPPWVNVIRSSTVFEYVDQDIETLIKNKDILGIFKKTIFFIKMKTGLIKKQIRSERKKLLLNRYDVEFSAKEGFCTIFTAYGDSYNKLNWIQTDYKVNNYAKRHMRLLKDALKYIDINIACSKPVANAFKEAFDIKNVVVIPNMIDQDKISTLANEEIKCERFEGINLICVARFHPQKGLDRLINAMKYIKDHGIKAHLNLIGDGLLIDDIKQQVKRFDLTNEVAFLGYQVNPYPYIKQSDLFVLSSLYEGYPTIVIESLICSTPVLAVEVSGVKEQIVKEHYGMIVKNEQASLNTALLKLCRAQDCLNDYKLKLSSYRYENDKILEEICYYIDNKHTGDDYE